MKIRLEEGAIEQIKADVIVNSTLKDLTLSTGQVSKAILRAAGQSLKEECDNKYPNGIKYGQVAVTGGHGLKCRKIYHGTLPPIHTSEHEDALQVLCDLVCRCLKQAHDDKMASIAIPALGTGFLGYHPMDSATTMFQCIATFDSLYSDTTLQEVIFVIYNKGEEWKHIKKLFHDALYGDNPEPEVKPKLPANPFSETCVRERARNSCKKVLTCGHVCAGVKDEETCPPCLHGCDISVSQRAGDNCIICYTDELSAAPVIMLECTHLFHLHCVNRVLDNKWVGARITFSFSMCPICKTPMQHKRLQTSLKPILELNDDVRRKALTRLSFEKLDKCDDIVKPSGRFYNNAEGYAMDRYCYYQCFKCQTAYFGGTVECQAQAEGEDKYDPKELICGGCSNKQRDQICKVHGTDYLEYKCRYCCSVAAFFCFGTTHFCTKCHQFPIVVLDLPNSALPKCPAGPDGVQLTGTCPLKVHHPPTGEEFSLGCGICSNAETF